MYEVRSYGKDCRLTGKVCVHCGEKNKHHRTPCPKKLKNKEETTTNNAIVTNHVLSKEAIPNEETMMLATGEHIVMQIALAEATSTDQMLSEVTRVLMDAGSSRTYVTEKIVNKLKLKIHKSNKLTIYTFGISRPKEIMSPVVTLMLKSKDGNTVTVKANVVPKISGDMQRLPICFKSRVSIQKRFRLTDTLPQQTESSTIGVLIGSDYYHEMMSSEKVEVQEGLYLIKSKFGWIISGKTKTNERVHHENTMFVMTHSSTQVLPELQHFSNRDDSMLTPPNIDDFW